MIAGETSRKRFAAGALATVRSYFAPGPPTAVSARERLAAVAVPPVVKDAASLTGERITRRRNTMTHAGVLGALSQSIPVVYALGTWAQPHRAVVLVVSLASVSVALAVIVGVHAGLAESRWQRPVMTLFSAQQVLSLAVAALAAGGAASPPALGFAAPLVFATISLSPRRAAGFIALILGTYVAVAALGHPAPPGYVPVYCAGMLIVGLICTRQASAAHAQRMEFARQSRSDPLTGALNRRGFEEVLNAELSRARRNDTQVSLLIVDLDEFKAVNDMQGHAAGDALLRWTAETIASVLRAHDQVARFGGDEFTAVLPDTDSERAKDLTRRVGAVLCTTVPSSIAVATWPSDGETAEQLMMTADARLYAAKNHRHLAR